MKRNKSLVLLFSLLVVFGLVLGVAGCKKQTEKVSAESKVESSAKVGVEEENAEKVKVVVTTSLIENIVKEVGGDNFDITVMGSTKDRIVSPDELEKWREYTKKDCDIKIYDGEHFYLFDQAKKVCDLINRKLIG